MRTFGWRILPLFLFIALGLFFLRGLSLDPQYLPSAKIGKPLPNFNLPLLFDADKRMTPDSLKKKVALLNVWASWCAACIEEQVFMLKLSREGVPIYGINYKDKAENARRWLANWGNPYEIVAQDKDGKLAIDLGVYGAPETFLVDKEGIIQYRHVGILTEEDWKKDILPRMRQLELVS